MSTILSRELAEAIGLEESLTRLPGSYRKAKVKSAKETVDGGRRLTPDQSYAVAVTVFQRVGRDGSNGAPTRDQVREISRMGFDTDSKNGRKIMGAMNRINLDPSAEKVLSETLDSED